MKPAFITDLCESHPVRDESGKIVTTLPRFGVWANRIRDGKPEVIETGDNLEALRAKHGTLLPLHVIGHEINVPRTVQTVADKMIQTTP